MSTLPGGLEQRSSDERTGDLFRCHAFPVDVERLSRGARRGAATALPGSRRGVRPTTSATRPCTRRKPAPWRRRQRDCISTKPCSETPQKPASRHAFVTLARRVQARFSRCATSVSMTIDCTPKAVSVVRQEVCERGQGTRAIRRWRVIAVGTTSVRALEAASAKRRHRAVRWWRRTCSSIPATRSARGRDADQLPSAQVVAA